ncbi:N-(5'-phosphoribosyl)anthranilate isomerase [Virgibacillus xinjiangensis]|uniref:N-(5'-phosphoribosyl)anthranilate isomerase n=1 Tax=Virgibacillus xinjiangensis TaxID=393090 RepID=A0ABV7CZS0_9BACI
MKVKICGVKTISTAHTAIQAGADFIGFVFAPSTRRITPEDAALIAHSLPSHANTVGVFVNESTENILQIANQVGLDYIQLHGDESESKVQELPYKTIKAFPFSPQELEGMEKYPCDYYLIDSPKGQNRGGNGTTFNWSMTETLPVSRNKTILAGGLTPANIQQAIEMVNPAAVDVSSGVETNGEKDPAKIREFIKKAKQTRKDEPSDHIYHA